MENIIGQKHNIIVDDFNNTVLVTVCEITATTSLRTYVKGTDSDGVQKEGFIYTEELTS